jgi:hypothetical protein
VTVETVRGDLTDERAEQLLAFWASQNALGEAEARRRLPEVLCVLIDEEGRVAGVNSAFAAELPLIGNHRLWIYRSLLAAGAPESSQVELFRAGFALLDEEFQPGGGMPLGVCVVLADPADMRRFPEAESDDPRLVYVGYMGRQQVRVGYFARARLGSSAEAPWQGALPSVPLGELHNGYRVDPIEAAPIDRDAVVEMWTREQILSVEEAGRRVDELLLVATDPDGVVAGVSTAYPQRNQQLQMDLWNMRGFVAPAHRQSDIALRFLADGTALLQQRFVSGEDTRGAGVLLEVENEGLKQYFDMAWWEPTGHTFIGYNAHGDHVRVKYFPGALAPLP